MELFAESLKEMSGYGLVHKDYGFAIYELRGHICHISYMFITRDQRGKGFGSDLLNVIESFPGITKLTCELLCENPQYRANLAKFKAVGFKKVKKTKHRIVLHKELKR